MDRLTYDAAIDMLRDKDPGNAMLPELAGNYTFVNTKYLQAALKKLDLASADAGILEKKKKVRKPESNPILRDLFQQRSKVFGKRSKASNQFHICETDEERAAVSDDIQVLQKEWARLSGSIATYEDTGQLPQTAKKYPVPRSEVERFRLRNTLRSQCSNKRAAIKKKATALTKTTDKKKQIKLQLQLDKAEAKLKDLETHLAYVDAAIKG